MTPFRILIIFIVLSLIGLAFIPELSVNLNPQKKQRSLKLSYSLTNASPSEVERLATAPLENSLSQLRELENISSVSRYDQGSVELTFSKNADLDYKRFEIASLLRSLYPQLDPAVSYPRIGAVQEEESEQDILSYTLTAPMAAHHIKEVLENTIVKNIQSVEGVKELNIYGARPLQLGIYFNSHKLDALGFTANDIKRALNASGGIDYPGIALVGKKQYISIAADQRFKDLDALRELLVYNQVGQSFQLEKLAEIVKEEQEASAFHRINAKNFITLSITAMEGINRIKLARKLKALMEESKTSLPASFELRLVNDDTEYLEKELDKLYSRSILSILILVTFIFLINRNWRYLFVLFAGILVNCCLAILGVWLFNIQIHLYSLAGLTISFGLIVDNAIVMIDHLHKYKNKHVFLALLAASLTTIAALLLVLLLPEEQQRNLLDFSKVVALLLAVSLVVALFFTPALYQLLFSSRDRTNGAKINYKKLRKRAKAFVLYERMISYQAGYKKLWIIGLILLFGTPIFLLPSKWEGHSWYNYTIGSNLYQDDIRPISDPLLGGSLRLFVRNVYERSSYREKEKTRLYVQASLPYGNTLEQMDRIIRNIENFLSPQEGIALFTTNIYSGQFARIEITFKEAYEMSGYPFQLKARLSAKSTNWSGVDWSIYGVGQGFSTGSGGKTPTFRVKLKGYNYQELQKQAEYIADQLLQHPRVQEVNLNEKVSWRDEESQEYVLSPKMEALARQNLSLFHFVESIKKYSPANGFIDQLEIEGDFWPVKLEERKAKNFDKYKLENESLRYDSLRIPVAQVSKLNLQQTVNALYKEDRNYIRVLSFEYYGSARFGLKHLEKVLAEYEKVKPLGFTAERNSYSWNSDEAKKQYGLLGILIIAIFFICSILFESFKLPFYILLLIPLSFVGLFLTFGYFEFFFDQGGYAAFVMLGGLTVNAGIYILYDFKNRKDQSNRSFLKAISYKSTPILLTIFSTCFGLVPFIMGGQNEIFWFSLAAGTIGGLLFSMVGVFFFLPLLNYRRKG